MAEVVAPRARQVSRLQILRRFAFGRLLPPAGDAFWELEQGPSGQAPDPSTTSDAIVQVYAARATAWHGLFAVHTWLIAKPTGAQRWTRYEVIGNGVDGGAPAVRVNERGPDDYWFGLRPAKVFDRRGPALDPVIARIADVVPRYPYPTTYRLWPGPNSNTFIAWIGRQVPQLRLTLPPTAIGKDYLAGRKLVAATPSGTGVQLSVFGLGGVAVGWHDGIEVNVCTLSFGIDVMRPAVKLPLVGRLGRR